MYVCSVLHSLWAKHKKGHGCYIAELPSTNKPGKKAIASSRMEEFIFRSQVNENETLHAYAGRRSSKYGVYYSSMVACKVAALFRGACLKVERGVQYYQCIVP